MKSCLKNKRTLQSKFQFFVQEKQGNHKKYLLTSEGARDFLLLLNCTFSVEGPLGAKSTSGTGPSSVPVSSVWPSSKISFVGKINVHYMG